MGFWSGVCSAVSGACSAICSVISHACSAIGGALSSAISCASSALTGVLSPLVTQLSPVLGTITQVTGIACSIVSAIAETLNLKEVDKDEPAELAMKAEQADVKPEDFDSTEAYIKAIQSEVLSETNRQKLENMPEEELAAYKVTGTYLYTKAADEKLGIDNSGLANPELVGIASILPELVKLSSVLSPSDFVTYSKHLQTSGLSTKDFANYLHGTSNDIAVDKKVQDAMVGAMKEINPSITESDIDKKLFELNIED